MSRLTDKPVRFAIVCFFLLILLLPCLGDETSGGGGGGGGGQGGRRRPRMRNRAMRRGLPRHIQSLYMNAHSMTDDDSEDSTANSPGTSPDTDTTDQSGIGTQTRSATRQGGYSEATEEEPENHLSGNDWSRYAPSLPAPSEVECDVYLVSTVRRGGVCTRLGGNSRPAVCQSGSHFEFSSYCAQLIRQRERDAASLDASASAVAEESDGG